MCHMKQESYTEAPWFYIKITRQICKSEGGLLLLLSYLNLPLFLTFLLKS